MKDIESSFFVGRAMILFAVAKDASSFAMRISWLNFEPWSQSFLQSKPNSGFDCLGYSIQYHCSFVLLGWGRKILFVVADDASSLACASVIFDLQRIVSWLFL